MKPILGSALLLLAFATNAQAPTPVPIPKEPHHHLVLENEYVRVFRVSIPGHDATLLHQHDVPYIYVSLGPADVINAVQGKPEARIVMADGQVGYSPGHFAHIARTDAGSSFDNVTIELLKPQGEAHNDCASVIPNDPSGYCDPPWDEDWIEAEFETSEMRVDLVRLSPKAKHTEAAKKTAILIVGLADSGIKVVVKGKPAKELRQGDIEWFGTPSDAQISNAGNEISAFLEITFKDDQVRTKP
jgi:hypothetical protein